MKEIIKCIPDQKARTRFVIDYCKKIISEAEAILDVGSLMNVLKDIVGDKVVGIDVIGKPDIIVDLEKERLSIFDNDSFDLIVCNDVLEHLDNFHEIMDDIVRVMKKGGSVVISLPNCTNFWRIWNILLHDNTGKMWGLPYDRYIYGQKDSSAPLEFYRHKWFFSWREADVFFREYSKNNGLVISDAFLLYNYSNSIAGKIIRAMLRVKSMPKLAETYYVLMKKA